MTSSLPRYVLKARYVFPVTGPPIEGGVVTIEGERIAAVGKDVEGCEPIDLGNVAIVPGLCNAHTHLDLSSLAAPLGEAGMAFPDWIHRVVACRREGKSDPLAAVQSGIEESARAGVTTIGDIASPGSWLDTINTDSAYVTVFLELIGLRPARTPALIELAQAHVLHPPGRSWRPGLSPHAPYTVHPELLEQVVRRFDVPVAMHLAESREELELLRSGGGPFKQLLIDLDAWDEAAIPLGTRPLDYLRTLSRARRTLVIHGNYLDDEEIEFLAAHADRMALVYCPRTHAYFRHDRYPLSKLLTSGVAMALGTDSRASNPDLDLLAEMRFVARHHPEVPLTSILRLGTLGGAESLDRPEVGSLKPGAYADLAVIRLPDREAADPHELLFESNEPALATMRRGTIVATHDDHEAARWRGFASVE